MYELNVQGIESGNEQTFKFKTYNEVLIKIDELGLDDYYMNIVDPDGNYSDV